VKEQLGHGSIQITVDTYGHLIPGANRCAMDRLDDVQPMQRSATQAQPNHWRPTPRARDNQKLLEESGEPGRSNRFRAVYASLGGNDRI